MSSRPAAAQQRLRAALLVADAQGDARERGGVDGRLHRRALARHRGAAGEDEQQDPEQQGRLTPHRRPPPARRAPRGAGGRRPRVAGAPGRGRRRCVRSSSTSTRSASARASSTSCVTSRMPGRWRSQRSSTRRCIEMRVSASRAPNGSSSSSSSGRRTSARASEARWASPPESVSGQASARSVSPTSSSVVSAASRASGRCRPSATLSVTLRHGSRRGSWKATATEPGTSTSPETPSLRGVVEAGEHPQQRALARAAATEQRDELAVGDGEVEAVEDAPVAERAGQAAHLGGAHRCTLSGRHARALRSSRRTRASVPSPSRA